MFLFAWCVDLPSAVSRSKNNNPSLAACFFFESQQICPSQVKVIAKWILSGIKHVAEKEQVFLIFHCAARGVSVVITNFQPGPKRNNLHYTVIIFCVCACVCVALRPPLSAPPPPPLVDGACSDSVIVSLCNAAEPEKEWARCTPQQCCDGWVWLQ